MTHDQPERRIEQLRKLINDYRYHYHVLDESIMSEAAADSLKHELSQLEAEHPELITPDSPTQRVAGKALDTEDHCRLTDRLSALANRRRAADAVSLYESFLARGLPVPVWTKRDIAGSYLELRQPQHAASLYYEVVSANPDDFDANLGLFYALVESEELDAATQHIDTFAAPCLSADIAMANTTASA